MSMATEEPSNEDLLRMVLVLANRIAHACQKNETCSEQPANKPHSHMKCVACVTDWARKEAGRVRG